MSNSTTSPADQIQELAKEIFVGLAIESGPQNWDWNPIAQGAFNAAQSFFAIQTASVTPQQSVPSVAPTPAEPSPAGVTPTP